MTKMKCTVYFRTKYTVIIKIDYNNCAIIYTMKMSNLI